MAMSIASSSTSLFPTVQEIKLAMESAGTSIEAAEYLQDQVTASAKQAAIRKNPELSEKASAIVDAVKGFVELVRAKFSLSAQPWSGESPVSLKGNMLENIANSALKDLEGLVDTKLYYAVSEKGHFVRGYSADNAALDQNAVAAMDKLFNAWLATKGYDMQDGYFYKEGKKASAVEVEGLLNDGSMQQYMDKKGVANVSMQTQDYPSEEKTAQAKHQVEAAVEQANSETQKPGSHT
jgi:hypothetical protein